MKAKTLRLTFSRLARNDRYEATSYILPGEWTPKLCASQLREYVDIAKEENFFDLTMTTKRPRGNNFHELRWSRAEREHYLALVGRSTRPTFYSEFLDMLKLEFQKRTVYAWVEA
jgi:hypothetical protein